MFLHEQHSSNIRNEFAKSYRQILCLKRPICRQLDILKNFVLPHQQYFFNTQFQNGTFQHSWCIQIELRLISFWQWGCLRSLITVYWHYNMKSSGLNDNQTLLHMSYLKFCVFAIPSLPISDMHQRILFEITDRN